MLRVAQPEPLGYDTFPIAARIVIASGMKRLMQVADQMEEEFHRHQPFLRIGTRVGEFNDELIALIDDAA